MSKPKPVFKAPDGKEFESRAEMRDYLMANYYSFKNRTNENLSKISGEVDGQVFDIADCQDTSIAIMDTTDQVQIDNLKNCKVMIGAGSSSVFIRNCTNCVFYICARQIRLREVTDSSLLVFSPSEVHIEESSSVKFGPFMGGYADQEKHFKSIGLPSDNNLWYDIYDHNDPAKTRKNWSLLTLNEAVALSWYPAGGIVTNFIHLTRPPKQATSAGNADPKEATQVGQSFSIEQMMADAAAQSAAAGTSNATKQASQPAGVKKITAVKPPTKLILETALLIATATLKGTNLSVWFNEQSNHGRMSVQDFDDKLISLAKTMSINQDEETKKELDTAVSANALRVVHSLCALKIEDKREESGSVDGIDVKKFLKLAKSLADSYLEGISAEDEEEAPAVQPPVVSAAKTASAAPVAASAPASKAAVSKVTVKAPVHAPPADGDYEIKFDSDGGSEGDYSPLPPSHKHLPNSHPTTNTHQQLQQVNKSSDISIHLDGGDNNLGSYNPSLGVDSSEHIFTATEYLSNSGRKITQTTESHTTIHTTSSAPATNAESFEAFSPTKFRYPELYNIGEQVVKIPSSPYDEAVLLEEDEAADSAEEYYGRRGRRPSAAHGHVNNNNANANKHSSVEGRNGRPTTAASSRVRDSHTTETMERLVSQDDSNIWEEENKKYLMRSSSLPQQQNTSNRPQSAPRLRNGATLGNSFNDPGLSHSVALQQASRYGNTLHTHNNSSSDLPLPRRTRSQSTGRSGTGLNTSFSSLSRGGTTGGTSTAGVSKSSADRLAHLKDVVEDLVRNTVKKVDLYHLIQVNLGFIDTYTMIPPRGSIVTARPREWLTMRDLQTAFLAGRLCLTEPQVLLLRSLVVSFSRQYEAMYNSTEDLLEKGGQETEVPAEQVKGKKGKKNAVCGPAQTLSAQWLKKYLIHLRLTKKKAVIPTTTTAAAEGEEQRRSNLDVHQSIIHQPVNASNRMVTSGTAAAIANHQQQLQPQPSGQPIQWKEWLGNKLKGEMDRAPLKPMQFEKALEGQPHSLSKEDVDKMLKKYRVLPPEYLAQEIELRIKAWVVDMNGRKDFSHALNVKIRNWIWLVWKQKMEKDNVKLPKNEAGYWKLYDNLSDEKKKEVRTTMTNTLVAEKRQHWQSKERSEGEITKDLYWKYDSVRKEKSIAWLDWLPSHLSSFAASIKRFREDEQNRETDGVRLTTQKKAVAGLNDVEAKLSKAANLLDKHHKIELQKGIVALRREAEEKGIAKGTVITKADFDKHIKRILIPHIKIEDASLRSGASQPVGQSEVVAKNIQELFHSTLDSAVDRVLDVERIKAEENKKKYDDWLADKIQKEKDKKLKELEEASRLVKEKADKEKKGKKEYKKWLKMRKQHKYKSMVDKKYHEVPQPRKIEHTTRFNVEKEMGGYYAEIEKRF